MTNSVDNEEGVEVKKTFCQPPPGCGGRGLLVNVRNNKIISVKGNWQFTGSRDHICGERFPHFIKWLEHLRR